MKNAFHFFKSFCFFFFNCFMCCYHIFLIYLFNIGNIDWHSDINHCPLFSRLPGTLMFFHHIEAINNNLIFLDQGAANLTSFSFFFPSNNFYIISFFDFHIFFLLNYFLCQRNYLLESFLCQFSWDWSENATGFWIFLSFF